MSFKLQSISAEAHELEAKVEAAEGRATKVAQVIAKHVEEIAKEIGGYITVSGGGHLNSVEGQPGDSVWLNVNSLPNPAKPTPSGLVPPEASTANPQPGDGSPAAVQEAVPQPVLIGAEDAGQPPIVPDRDVSTQAQPQPADSQVPEPVVDPAHAGWEGAATAPDGTTAENREVAYTGIGSPLPAESNLPVDPEVPVDGFPLVTGGPVTATVNPGEATVTDVSGMGQEWAPVVTGPPATAPDPTVLPVEPEPVPPPTEVPPTWGPVEPAVDPTVPAPPFSDPPVPGA